MGGIKERGARQPHKRPLYCFNVNRTSLDHLLLGKSADVDKSVECSEYSAGPLSCQNKQDLAESCRPRQSEAAWKEWYHVPLSP